MSIHVFPTAPSPTTTHFISLSVLAILGEKEGEGWGEDIHVGGREGGREGERKVGDQDGKREGGGRKAK